MIRQINVVRKINKIKAKENGGSYTDYETLFNIAEYDYSKKWQCIGIEWTLKIKWEKRNIVTLM